MSPAFFLVFLFTFPLLFVGIWIGVVRLIALGGWEQLAARYPADAARPAGGERIGQSAVVGQGRYSGTVRVTLTDEALHLASAFPFRAGHAPIAIPWEAVAGRERTAFGLRLRLHDGPAVTFGGRTAERLVAFFDDRDAHARVSLADAALGAALVGAGPVPRGSWRRLRSG